MYLSKPQKDIKFDIIGSTAPTLLDMTHAKDNDHSKKSMRRIERHQSGSDLCLICMDLHKS